MHFFCSFSFFQFGSLRPTTVADCFYGRRCVCMTQKNVWLSSTFEHQRQLHEVITAHWEQWILMWEHLGQRSSSGESPGRTTVRQPSAPPFWLQRMRNVSCFCSWDTTSRQRSTLVSLTQLLQLLIQAVVDNMATTRFQLVVYASTQRVAEFFARFATTSRIMRRSSGTIGT